VQAKSDYVDAARSSYAYESGEKIRTVKPWGFKETLVRELRLCILRRCQGNRTKAAVLLGETVRGLRLNLDRYRDLGFEIPEYESCACYVDRNKLDALMGEILKLLRSDERW
jgi:hypothetical protein